MLDSWLTLFYTPYIGAKRFRQLIDHFGSAEGAVQADHLEWQVSWHSSLCHSISL